MEYIYGNADKYKTRIMEEYARAFYREMQFIDPISKSIKGFFRILRCCDDKVICYRHIDESLKEDLENMNNGCSKMTLGKNWFISAIKHDKFENSYTFALYNGSAEIMTMKEYICYQVNYFFESLLGLAEKKNGDVEISIRNMIYENAIAFVDRKINNTINMAMGPRVMLAENISKISYLHYEGNKVNKKYIVWGIKKEDCDIIFSNDIMFNDETKLNHDKQIRKLLEITYKDKNNGLYLGCCGNKVEGYISSENLKGELYLVEFNGTGKWSFGFQGSEKNKIIFEDKKVKLFKDDDKVTFYLAYKKIFEEDTNIDYVWKIVESERRQKHGTMLLFTENALSESERLREAGYQVSVKEMVSARSIEALGEIDGAMLLDQYGRFYMIGVILDGTMPPKGVDKGRGARYNSAVKYSYSHKEEKHLLIIISEDGYFDMINYNYM